MTAPTDTRVTALDPAFAALHSATERHVWDLPRLTTREKVFLSVVADVCNQTLGLPFELHINTGLSNGVIASDIRDLLRCVAFETGYPAALAALQRLAELEDRHVIARHPAAVTATADPAAVPPPSVRASWTEVDGGFDNFMELQAGLIGEVAGLSIRERAFAAITCDVLYQTLEETLRIHIGRARGAGAEADDIRAVLRFTTQFGVTKAWRAFRALDTHLTEFDRAQAAR
jgi:alkylhydroperoxidase/carboxymuconolactone decarboxylase family protein YurZ